MNTDLSEIIPKPNRWTMPMGIVIDKLDNDIFLVRHGNLYLSKGLAWIPIGKGNCRFHSLNEAVYAVKQLISEAA